MRVQYGSILFCNLYPNLFLRWVVRAFIEPENAIFEIIDNPKRIVELVGKGTAADPSDTAGFGLRSDGDRGKNGPSSWLVLRNFSVVVTQPPQELFGSIAPNSMDSLVVVDFGSVLEVVVILVPYTLESCTVVLFVIGALFLRKSF